MGLKNKQTDSSSIFILIMNFDEGPEKNQQRWFFLQKIRSHKFMLFREDLPVYLPITIIQEVYFLILILKFFVEMIVFIYCFILEQLFLSLSNFNHFLISAAFSSVFKHNFELFAIQQNCTAANYITKFQLYIILNFCKDFQ